MSYRTWVWFRRIAALGVGGYYGWLTGEPLAKGLVAVVMIWLLLTIAGRLCWWIEDIIAHGAGRFDPEKRARREWQGEGGPFSRWMRRGEAADYGRGASGGWETHPPSYGPGKAFLGRALHSLRPVGIKTQKHLVTIGQPGSGKSTSVLAVNAIFHRGSLLLVDPKGELATITAARRGQGGNGIQGLGQDVHILDPFGTVPGSTPACYNVFDEMAAVAAKSVDRPVSYAGKVADALIPSMSERDKYWDNAARTLVRGLVLYVFLGERRDLSEVRRLLMEGDTEEWKKLPADLQGKINSFECLFEKMKLDQGPYRDAIAGAGASLLMMGPNQMGSVLTTAQEHTAFLDAPELKRTVSRSDFLLEDFKTKRLSVYLCLPLNMVAGKESRWLRLFVMLFIDMMIRSAKPPPEPVLLMIDEFPNLGRIDGIVEAAATLRGYGVRLHLAGQDIPQFKATYPEQWQTILGSAEAVQFLGVTEGETVDYLSKRLGRHIVKGRMPMMGREEAVMEERAVMEPAEVALFLSPDLGNQIVWRGNKKPMKLRATPYFEYVPPWQYSPDPRFAEPARRARWRK